MIFLMGLLIGFAIIITIIAILLPDIDRRDLDNEDW